MTEANQNLEPEVPDELRELNGLLEALGRHDASSSGPGFDDRIAAASISALQIAPDVSPVSRRLEVLASAERRAAPADLEDHAFELSREAIAGGRGSDIEPPAPIRLAESPVVVRRSLWMSRTARIAAALVVGGGGFAAAVLMLRGNTSPVPGSNLTLAERFDNEFDSLFEVIATESHDPIVNSETGEYEPGWLDDLFNRESL